MKHFKTSTWIFWSALTIVSLFIWFKLSYPHLSAIDLSVRRSEALHIAEQYLQQRDVNPADYKRAIIFSSNNDADRFLQKNIGFEKEREFIENENLDLFYWKIRFFKEYDKEEFRLIVSSQTGAVISFLHTIPDSAERPPVDEDMAKEKITNFLREKFGFNPDLYTIYSNQSQKYDHRVEHSYIWHKNDVDIPWKDQPESGGAKLLMGATISGDEILYFTKNEMHIPDAFDRYIEQQKQAGQNFATLFRIFYILIISAATFIIVTRRHHVTLQSAKKFYIRLTIVLFSLNILYNLSEYESILFYYKTSSSLSSYLLECTFSLLNQIFFLTLSILMPGLAGETLHYELSSTKEGSWMHYIRTTFFSRDVFSLVVFGYLVAGVLIGFQSLIFRLGNQYLGVWQEQSWLTQLSSSYSPFLAAFILACQASVIEEVTFRVFGINWGKKILKNTILAVFLSSILWGFGHTQYLIFPTWFRGVEVSCIGILLGFIYLRFGIFPVIVAHYLFDAFCGTAAYILGHSTRINFFGSIFILAIPLLYGLLAMILNRKGGPDQLTWQLNEHQKFNLNILERHINQGIYLKKTNQEILQEFGAHGWDIAVIEMALKNRKL